MKIAFLTAGFSYVVLDRLRVLCNPDELIVVDFSKDKALASACRSLRVRHLRFSSWKDVQEALAGCDLLVSYSLHKVIPMYVVRGCRFGGLNVHPSLLPKYRGLNPWFHMYVNMDLAAGVTIHRISEKLDCGGILAQHSFLLEPGQPLPLAKKTADSLASDMLAQVIQEKRYLSEGIPQPNVDVDDDCHVMLDGFKLFPAERLWHVLRGFPDLITRIFPQLPHKYFEVGEYSSGTLPNATPGIVDLADGVHLIRCIDGVISLCDFSKIPMTQDYLDAVETEAIDDGCIRSAEFQRCPDGSLSFEQGREAVVFPVIIKDGKFAVRCPRNMAAEEIEEYVGRLTVVRDHLIHNGLTHFPEFEIRPEAMRLKKGLFPAVVMKWHSGVSLMTYIRRHFSNRQRLRQLLTDFIEIFKVNHESGTVHGDLHSGNVIVDADGGITLLDIDSLWTPDVGLMPDSGGHRNFQHPLRMANKYFGPRLSLFSEIIICATIYCAIQTPELFVKYSQEEWLFQASDFMTPHLSPLFMELEKTKPCASMACLLKWVCRVRSLDDIPSIETLDQFNI